MEGEFSFVIEHADLVRGLRPSRRNPRNEKFLTKADRAIGLDGVLHVLDDLSEDQLDTSLITDGFPYPQLFVFPAVIVVCGKTKVYEYSLGALSLKLTVDAGTIWSGVSYFDYIYMSNGKVSIERDPNTSSWALSTLPIARGICDLNGQVMIGAPGAGS